ncbi:MAG: in-like serine protease [Acidimicrobiales bacterium]|nr:in-like serine protease [Acidimicrobiales bacterium]
MSGNERKLDPRLRLHAPRRARAAVTSAKHAEPEDLAQVFVEVANSDARKWIKKQRWVKDFVQVVDGYCTATVVRDRIAKLAAHAGVVEVEAVRFYRPQLDVSVGSIHGWAPPANTSKMTQGVGVIVGIVDYGLDFTLADFRDQNNKTRIKYLWDQELSAQGNEKAPAKYKYGVEYSGKDIDDAPAAVRHHAVDPESDVSGHGSHVAGIAAGNGQTGDQNFPPGHYVGVAPGANIIFVHLNRKSVLAQVESDGGLANSVNLVHAITYCFEKADELGMPCVVNLSMGFNDGGHDGNTEVEWAIDALLQRPGRAVVVAAGNENREGKAEYFRGSIPQGQTFEVAWDTGFMISNGVTSIPQGDVTPNEMEIWYASDCEIAVELVAPREDQASAQVKPDDATLHVDFEGGEHAVINSQRRTPWDGAARIHIHLNKGAREKGIRAGKWVVRLHATTLGRDATQNGGVRFDAWIERTIPDDAPRYMRSRFKDFEPAGAITITTPGTARRAITVASCDSDPVNPKISDFSGRGPTRDERKKPDLAAPGYSVVSTNAGSGSGTAARRTAQGTSMSAPHVAGVIARLLSRHHFLTAAEIWKILVETADIPSGATAPRWDPAWGYGRVNAEAAMKCLEEKLR